MPGFDPDQPRDENGRWTDAGQAIKNAASDKFPVGIAFAPYRSKQVNTPDEDNDIRKQPEYMVYQNALNEAAENLDINIWAKMDTWGGYVDSETGVPVQEVSNVIQTDATPEKAILLAAILGKAAPEQQDSVLVGTHSDDGNGIEYTIKTGSFSNARKAIDSFKQNGIQYFTINKNNGDIIILDTDNSIANNVVDLVSDLKEKKLYENLKFSRTNAEFVTHDQYDQIIEKYRGEARTEKGFDIDAFIQKTKAKYAKKRVTAR